MDPVVFIEDPWEYRKYAIFGWYHIYRRIPWIRRCVNIDIFRKILGYLDAIDLTIPLHLRNNNIARLDNRVIDLVSGYFWEIGVIWLTPCHVCMRPCGDHYSVLCEKHAHPIHGTGLMVKDRLSLLENCSCEPGAILMEDNCVKKIKRIIVAPRKNEH